MKIRQFSLVLWVAALIALAALHFVHLQADFPNYSRWMDWSKYTDEGWYANGAIEHFIRGSWYVPGDFNSSAAVPLWPFLTFILFHLTGMSIQAARGLSVSLFCLNLFLSYRLIRKEEKEWVALLACSLLASSSFMFCFSRLAILEPLLISLTLASLLLAEKVGAIIDHRRRMAAAALVGVLFCGMVLTKTTAVFLLPALLYSLWYPLRKDLRAFFRVIAAMGLTAATLWGSYFFLFVRPYYLADYKYLFYVNVFQRPSQLLGWLATGYYAVHGALWIDRVLVAASVLLLVLTVFLARTAWRNPLFVSSVLAIAGYFFFIAYDANMQPRYYAVIAFFLFFVVTLACASLLRTQRGLGVAALVVVCCAMAKSTWELGGFVLHPQYTFVDAARNLTNYIDQHPNGNRMLVSISGNDISLITGLPSLCDDFGTLPLPDKLAKYKPGWYAGWNELDPGTLEDLQTEYSLQEVANYKAFDDEERNTLVLYKLIPLKHPQDVSTETSAGAL